MSEPLKWYGYMHISGNIHVKRFMGDFGDLDEARNSDFVQTVHGPFEARDREDAMIKMVRVFNENQPKVSQQPTKGDS